jgi:hypothetical protein
MHGWSFTHIYIHIHATRLRRLLIADLVVEWERTNPLNEYDKMCIHSYIILKTYSSCFYTITENRTQIIL